ncbi:MarR family transcriptional regulator [Natronococcus sp. JC468]|uniref:helix-turn-helix domain-containing protein n=1 Tax=Natronococcus sp. JC468 TaxID=1961921 RepID=UPI00143AAFAC|nr:helix-turn-helix domain-containing protein [Natronococcus sp. JC468]NKE35613.1 MarR family transcriptional regulator [Natronococcus sp. JC468]
MSLDLAAESDGVGVRTQADGGVLAQLTLSHPELVLQPSLRRAPEVAVEPEYWTDAGDDRTLLFVTASGAEFRAFETALGIDPTVADPVLVDRGADRRSYRLELTDRAITLVEASAIVGGRLRECASCRDGWRFRIRFPDRDALVGFNDRCRDRGVSVSVDHLRPADADAEAFVPLTEKQRELLTVAYEEGYFDVPRRISQNELADRLGVSKSAVSQRLRRAIAQLCGSTLA